MKIFMACPAPPGSRKGNRVTAVRWAGFLKALGHRLRIGRDYDGKPCDLMIALHARKSYPAIARFRTQYPQGPLILCLTGTDLYRDIRTSKRAQRALEWADRLVVLQERAADELPGRLREKVRVIVQSAEPAGGRPVHTPPLRGRQRRRAGVGGDPFDVAVLGHLRHEKDPFRTALALRFLSNEVPIRVTHLGEALSDGMAKQARRLMQREPRYRWLGEVARGRARRLLARSHLMVLSSRMEGGANVISEALTDGVPILASRIPGSVGLLGKDYPGFYPVEDTEALARLLQRAATDRVYYQKLKNWCAELAPMVLPAREREAWDRLLREFSFAKPQAK